MSSFADNEPRSSPEGSQTRLNFSPEGIPPTLVHAAAVNGNRSLLQRLLQDEYESLNQGDQFGRTPLVYSVLGDRLECAELLLKSGANVNQHDEDGRTPLHWAAYQGNHKCVKLLLSKGANWKAKDNEGRTPLHLATSHSSSKCLRLLLKRVLRGEADEPDNEAMTALHWSVSFDNLEHTRLLLKAGASIKSCDKENKSPLHWTATNKVPAIAKLLLDQHPEIVNWQDCEGRTALHLAIAQQNEALVETLISYNKCDVSTQDKMKRSPLHWAAILGNSKIVKHLLERNADYKVADGNGATALHYAAQSNFANTVEVFLSFPFIRDIPDNEGKSALMWAASKGADAALLVMLRMKLNVNTSDKTGGTALHAAAYAGHVVCTRLLLEYSADPNALDMINHTPLFRACEQGHTDVVALLLKTNATVCLEDQDGHSPLHWAALGGYGYICQMLIQQGVEPDKKDNLGRTPLHCAAFGGFANCMSVLLENGADVNMRDSKGVTALHWSCSHGQLEAVKLLLKNNAFPNYQSHEERGERLTPLDYAISGDNQEVAQYMVEEGAFTIEGIRDIAATAIQTCWRGFQTRKSFQNRKTLLMRHEQLKKNSKKRSNSIDQKNLKLSSPQIRYVTSDDGVKYTSDIADVKPQKRIEKENVARETSSSEGETTSLERKYREPFRNVERGAGDGQTDDESNAPTSVPRSTTGKQSVTLKSSGADGVTVRNVLSEYSPSEGRRVSVETESISSKFSTTSEDSEHYSGAFENSTEVSFDKSLSSEKDTINRPSNNCQQAVTTEKNLCLFVEKETVCSDVESISTAIASDRSEAITEVTTSCDDELAGIPCEAMDVIQKQITASKIASSSVLLSQFEQYRKEKERIHLIRRKVNAAITIQRAFRTYRKRTKKFTKHQELISRFRKENEGIKRQIAALTIQCSWHKHQRHQLQSSSTKRLENLSNLAAAVSENDRKQSIYGNNMQTKSYLHTSRKLQRARKQNDMKFFASSAALSYNLAVDLYHPLVSRQGDSRAAMVAIDGTRVRPKSMKRTKAGWVPDLPLSLSFRRESWISKKGR